MTLPPNKFGRANRRPRCSAQHWAAIRPRLVRSTVPVGGGRSPLALGITEAMRTLRRFTTRFGSLITQRPSGIAWMFPAGTGVGSPSTTTIAPSGGIQYLL
jgi:hypothetical protein